MGVEIERKFLVLPGAWRPSMPGTDIRQGYLSSVKERVVRVRIAGDRAYLTVKGTARDLTRPEFEYEIPHADGMQLVALCEPGLIEKTRFTERHGAHVWEIDVFHGANEGLVIAEIELGREDEAFERPSWLGADVSDDPRYLNANLVRHPYERWRSSAT